MLRVPPLLYSLTAAALASLGALILLAGMACAEAPGPQANDARLAGDANRTRFIADMSREVQFTVRTLADPYRIIVDLDEVNFQMPEGVGARGRGLVKSFRFGAFAAGRSRIVIDTTDPVIIEKAFVRPAGDSQPARLVIDMMRTTRADFMKQARPQPKAPAAGLGNSWAAATGEPLSPAARGKPVVVVDPGHGGIDPGTVGASGIYEKVIVLAFCTELKKKLEATGRFNVVMTRENDDFIPLTERVDMARARNAALFISIHIDAIDPKNPLLGADGPKVAQMVRGATIYTLDQDASDAEALEKAQRENRSDIMAGIETNGERDNEATKVLGDLLQRAAKNESREFASILLKQMESKMELNLKPKRSANFTVLRAAEFPSVLLELGYVSNAEDEKLLLSADWRAKAATLIATATAQFFERSATRLPF